MEKVDVANAISGDASDRQTLLAIDQAFAMIEFDTAGTIRAPIHASSTSWATRPRN